MLITPRGQVPTTRLGRKYYIEMQMHHIHGQIRLEDISNTKVKFII